MEQPDAIIHQKLRLKIMAALKALPRGERLEFVRLRAIVNATEGNLGAHIGTLETGTQCHLAIWDIERPAELVYRIGFNPLHARVWRGHSGNREAAIRNP